MEDHLDVSRFLILREQVDELARLLKTESVDNIGFPAIAGGGDDELDVVGTSDVLSATLTAISSGTRRLEANGGITLGGEPINMQLSAEYVGMLDETREIFIRVKPGKKATKGK